MLTVLLIFFFIVINIFSKKKYFTEEKSRPFECGFNPKILNRRRFSLQFFLIAILFLVFDIELVILFPFLINLMFLRDKVRSIIGLFFLLILLIGLIYEWIQKSLEWACC